MGPQPKSCSTLSYIWISCFGVHGELIRMIPGSLFVTRLTILDKMTSEVGRAEGLDTLTLSCCSPLSLRTDRGLRLPPSSCRLLTPAFVPKGPRSRGPPSALLFVWIRCTRDRCLLLASTPPPPAPSTPGPNPYFFPAQSLSPVSRPFN